jgi:hypothetical protein
MQTPQPIEDGIKATETTVNNTFGRFKIQGVLIGTRRVLRYQRVIRIRKSKDRKHNGQKKNKNNDLQNTTQKTNDQEPRTPQKPGLSSDAQEG